jgi:putative Ca2+/H+ antiporter (TMEM165/GDT1 family)
MATLAFMLAAFFDPFQAGMVLAIICLHRGPWPIIVAAAIATLVSETVIALATDAYMWGELVAPRLISSLLQATFLYHVVWFIRMSRADRNVAQPREPRREAA